MTNRRLISPARFEWRKADCKADVVHAPTPLPAPPPPMIHHGRVHHHDCGCGPKKARLSPPRPAPAPPCAAARACVSLRQLRLDGVYRVVCCMRELIADQARAPNDRPRRNWLSKPCFSKRAPDHQFDRAHIQAQALSTSPPAMTRLSPAAWPWSNSLVRDCGPALTGPTPLDRPTQKDARAI